jgi:hypothetical protein
MTNTRRFLLFAGVTAAALAAQGIWLATVQPQEAAVLAVNQLNGGSDAFRQLQAWQWLHQLPVHFGEIVMWIVGAWCIAPLVRRTWHAMFGRRNPLVRTIRWMPVVLAAFVLTGCIRSYDKPEYAEIDTSETGFLIPLEGDTNQQARFESVEYLQGRKVAAKRVQISHRWNQEGRFSNDGHWFATVRLVKVNRSPVTREWTAESKSTQTRDKAIWIESADSVGFSMGFTCTAFIDEKDAATFLYWYPSGSLADVMDTEVRARTQQASAEVAARYPLDLLRSKKQEIADAVRADVTSFFTKRGITITTVGMFGGMTYENPEIQKAIDNTFIAQQLKVVSEAKFEAQKKENERIELEATATAGRTRLEARGKADARLAEAQAEAEGIRVVSKAMAEAATNSAFLEWRRIDVEKIRAERWTGQFPQTVVGEKLNALFNFPMPAAAAAASR